MRRSSDCRGTGSTLRDVGVIQHEGPLYALSTGTVADSARLSVAKCQRCLLVPLTLTALNVLRMLQQR